MRNGRNMELPGQNPRIHPNGKYRIPRSGQFQDSEQEYHQSIPQWEKNFCTRVCKMPWKRICETQQIIYLYPKVDKWDASAAKEAFELEKARYWAEINDLPFDIPHPDPDEYHDIVDDDAADDPELIEDLYKDPETVKGGGESVICWDAFHLANNYGPGWDEYNSFKPTGWEVDEQRYDNFKPGWEVDEQRYDNFKPGWEVDEQRYDNFKPGWEVDEQRYDNNFEPTGWEVDEQQYNNLEPTGWGDEAVKNKYDIKPTGWGDETDVNPFLEDNCGGLQVNRDYDYGCGKKEFGSRRYRGRKKPFYAVNSSVNWKAQKESSWQWQKTVS